MVGARAAFRDALLCGGGLIQVIGWERPPARRSRTGADLSCHRGLPTLWVGFSKLRLVRGLRT